MNREAQEDGRHPADQLKPTSPSPQAKGVSNGRVKRLPGLNLLAELDQATATVCRMVIRVAITAYVVLSVAHGHAPGSDLLRAIVGH